MSTRKQKKEHPLPDVVYVYEVTDGDNPYLVANRTASECASPEGPRFVGKFWLGRVDRVELKVRKTKVAK